MVSCNYICTILLFCKRIHICSLVVCHQTSHISRFDCRDYHCVFLCSCVYICVCILKMFNEYVYVYAYDVYIFLLTYILTKYQFSGFFYNNTSTSTIKYNQVQSSTIEYLIQMCLTRHILILNLNYE